MGISSEDLVRLDRVSDVHARKILREGMPDGVVIVSSRDF